jgi:hypothetical protein
MPILSSLHAPGSGRLNSDKNALFIEYKAGKLSDQINENNHTSWGMAHCVFPNL